MKYNSPHSTAAWGMMAKDWEQGVDYHRLSVDRLKSRPSRDPPCGPRRRALLQFRQHSLRHRDAHR